MAEEKSDAQEEIEKALSELGSEQVLTPQPASDQSTNKTASPNNQNTQPNQFQQSETEEKEIPATPKNETRDGEKSVLERLRNKERSKSDEDKKQIETTETQITEKKESSEIKKIKEKLEKAAEQDAKVEKAATSEKNEIRADQEIDVDKETSSEGQKLDWLPIIIAGGIGILIIGGALVYNFVIAKPQSVTQNTQSNGTNQQGGEQSPTVPTETPEIMPEPNEPEATSSESPSESPFGPLIQ